MRLIPIRERHDDRSNSSSSSLSAQYPDSQPSEPAPRTAEVPPSGGNGSKNGTGDLPQLRGIARVPTHTVGSARERRSYVRANLTLPLCVRTVAGRAETDLGTLSTQDISSSGIFFLCPRWIEPGTPIEMEVTLVDKPGGTGTVRMRTQASIVRVENAVTPGWHGLAAAFDDITFIRDEPFPTA